MKKVNNIIGDVMKKQNSQSDNIKSHLIRGNEITPLDALNDYGCFRLAAVIHNLRNEGMNITTKIIKSNGSNFASYSLLMD